MGCLTNSTREIEFEVKIDWIFAGDWNAIGQMHVHINEVAGIIVAKSSVGDVRGTSREKPIRVKLQARRETPSTIQQTDLGWKPER